MKNTVHWKEGYKVVRRHNKKLMSAILGSFSYNNTLWTGYNVYRYIIESVVRPKKGDGPLAVFNNLKTATGFLRGHKHTKRNLVIYRCQYIPSTETKLYQGNKQWATEMIGTVYADAVMLTERVS